MTTREQQEVRYWPTLKGLLVLAATQDRARTAAGVGAVEWAEQNYPGGYAMNGAGQAISRPVYDDPQSAQLYPGGQQS